jgi:Uma2 family endonuclease
MTAMPVRSQLTADDVMALPLSDETRHLQLVEGELVVFEPDMRHNLVQLNLLGALREWTRAAEGRGRVCLPLDVLMDERNVFDPDISWYREGRAPSADDSRPYDVPDLAAEIRSPSTWRYDVGAKKSVYERRGLPELWLVDTLAEQVLVFRRSVPKADRFDASLELERGEALQSPLLPGFALSLDELFDLS